MSLVQLVVFHIAFVVAVSAFVLLAGWIVSVFRANRLADGGFCSDSSAISGAVTYRTKPAVGEFTDGGMTLATRDCYSRIDVGLFPGRTSPVPVFWRDFPWAKSTTG